MRDGEDEDGAEDEGDGRESVPVVGFVPVDPVACLVGALLGSHHTVPRITAGVQHDGLREPREHHDRGVCLPVLGRISGVSGVGSS